jgi:hypothetical protein
MKILLCWRYDKDGIIAIASGLPCDSRGNFTAVGVLNGRLAENFSVPFALATKHPNRRPGSLVDHGRNLEQQRGRDTMKSAQLPELMHFLIRHDTAATRIH